MAGASARTGRRVGVLALQGDVGEHEQVLGELGALAVPVRTRGDLAGVEALVLPGGESTTMSLLVRSAGLEDELRARIGDGLPVLGTCAGMILLSKEVLDGRPDQLRLDAIDIAVRRNGFGRQVSSFETEIDIKGLDEPMHAVFIRAPLVERVGEGVDVLAEVDVPGEESVRRPVVCASGKIIVSSFHPELSRDGRLHEMLVNRIEGD